MKEKKRFKQVLFAFKICYLVYLLLAFNAFVNGTAWMNKASYALTVFGAGMVLWMIFRYKQYRKGYNLWLLGAFIASYLLSAVTHLSYGVMENIKGMIWLVLPLILVYLSAFDMSGEEIRREMRGLSGVYVLYCTVANIVSLSMIYWGRKYDYIDETGTAHGIGYRWNRLWGVYDDPNHGATITVIALFMLIYLFYCAGKLWQKVSLALLFLVNYVYLVSSDSRTGIMCLAAGIVFGGFLFSWIKKKKGTCFKRALVPLVCTVLVAGAVFAADAGLKVVHQPIDKKIVKVLKSKNKLPSDSFDGGNRKQDLKYNYSSGRIEIWKNGLQIVKESPVIGVGYRNIAEYAKKHFPDGYLVKNVYNVKYDSMHNLELDILIGQGILGVVIFLLLAGNTLVILYRNLHRTPIAYQGEMICSMAVAGALGVAGTFLSFIFYVNAPQNMCFWLFLGYTMRFCQIGAEEKL